MKYGKQVNDLKLVKKIMLILSLICTLVCLSGCDLWYQDLKGYLEHWSGSVQVNDVSVQSSPAMQKNSSGIDTISTYATVMATVNIINPENYSLDGRVGLGAESHCSVRIAGTAGTAVFPLTTITSLSSSSMEVQIAPLAQINNTESLAVEHTNFTVTFVPTRTENGLEVAEPRTITLRYNTPPRSPIELVYDSNQGKITWLGSDRWDIVQGTGSDLDDLIFWAWPSGITDPTHPDYVERFEVYEDGDLFDSAAAADFLMSKESSLQSYIPQEIKDAGYDIYCSLGTSGKTITVCAVDSEGVRSQMATSGIAPHKVILEANGGFFPSSGLPSVETYKAAGSPIVGSDLEVPFRDGYFLSGWTSNGSDISFPLSIDEPMTLVAQWTPYPADGDTGGETGGNTGSGSGSVSDATYSITYNANGADSGTVPASQTKLAGKMVFLAKNNGSLTKQDHSFSGWNTAADGTGTSYAEGASYTLDASITLYAQWTRWNQVEPVQFDVGAGNVNFNTQVTLSTATPNATIHYTVNGSGEQIGSAGQSVVITITSDATITAYGTCDGMIQSTETRITYKLNTYIVSYDGNGSDGGAVLGVQSFTSGSSATVTGDGTMTRTGYTFTGWNTATNGSGASYAEGARYSSDANLTLYAQWQPNTYTVTFNGNNSTSGSTTSQNFTYGVPQNLNVNGFQRTGYTFTGWNTATNGSGIDYADGDSYTATGDITLYAQWKGVDYTITYVLDGGTNHSGNPQGYTVADLPLELKTPTKTGYTFIGWFIDGSSSTGTRIETGVTGDITVTAHWQPNTYTVTFDGNNHTSGATSSQTFTHGVSQNLNANGFLRTDCTFVGWNTAADGTGTSYTDVASYTATGDITLYAQWNLNQDVDGKYIINDHTHLLWIAEKLKVGTISKFDIKLTADIVIPPNTWEPIDVTYSSIDGQGHSITLTEDFTDLEGESFGLFGVFNYGTVENLVLKGSITAQVEPGKAGVGAVSGSAYQTIFRNVMSEMKISNTGTGNAGGLVGYFGGGESNPEDALIESCAVYADVTSTKGYAGGLVGATWGGNQPWTIRNSIYIGTLSGKKVGGIVGVQNTTHPNTIYMSNLYYCTNAIDKFGEKPGAAIEDVSNVMSKTQDEIKNEGVTILGSAWELKSGGNYPTLIQP